ncbi:MAG: hypothetical protein LBC99_04185 [Spirochaetota bacterium]|nr:hypothetical protein [Spirochaetota bacterium]
MRSIFFPKGFFRSKPVWVVIVFCLGCGLFSRLSWVQERDLFMPESAIIERFPSLPREPQIAAPPQIEFNTATNLLTNFSAGGANGAGAKGFALAPEVKAKTSLEHFFRKLETTRHGGTARVLCYGDSQLWGDNITRRVRQRLLEHFPNGGRGLIPVMPEAGPNGDYMLSGVEQSASDGWDITMLQTMQHYKMEVGLTLRTYRALRDGAWTRVRLYRQEAADSLGILAAPGGAPISARFILTNDIAQTHNFTITETYTLLTNAIPWKEVLITAGKGAKLYGLDVRRNEGLSFAPVIRKGICSHDFPNIEREPFLEQLAAYKPDLFIWYFGKNESGWDQYTLDKYLSGMHWTVTNIRAASPETSILFIGPGPRMNTYRGPLRLFPSIPEMRQAQHDFGRDYGVAYFDSFNALGGVDGFLDMVRRGIAMTDYVHLTFRGGDMLADSFADNLLASWLAWLETPEETSLLSLFSKQEAPKGAAPTERTSGAITFDTVSYGFFLIIVFFVWWFLYHTNLVRVVFLLLASWFFYMSWNPVFVVLIIASSSTDFFIGMFISRALQNKRRGLARFWLALSLISSLGLLFFFKYFNFFHEVLFQLGISEGSSDVISLILPVGISFYTFQTMSYVLDIYRGLLEPIRSFTKFALFVSFFPQLVAGPIVRARDFLPQLLTKPNFDPVLMCNGFFFIMIGLFKKIVISDFIALNLADRVFASPELYTPIEVLFGVYAYGLQIYCDFSGYSDIAIGSAALFGFKLPLNFNSPYKAANLQDFWRRWHITLSTWLRDYLYIPLGGSRHGNARTYINLAITMLLGGLWHGAAWRFIIWGALHGIGLAAVRAWQRRKHDVSAHAVTGRHAFLRARKNATAQKVKLSAKGRAKAADTIPPAPAKKTYRFLAWFCTLHFVMFAWIFFRAPDMAAVGAVLAKIGGVPAAIYGFFSGGNPQFGDTAVSLAARLEALAPNITSLIALILFGGFALHFVPERWFESCREFFVKLPAPLQACCLLACMFLFYKTATAAVVPFIYFQF